MRICILTHCFYPSKLRGGPTVSMTNMVKAISDIGDVFVITVHFDKDKRQYDSVQEGHQRLFDSDVCYLKDNSIKAFFEELESVDPDVIYISSLFSWEYSLPGLVYGRSHKKRVILAPRGELISSAIKQKGAQKRVFIALLKTFGLLKNLELHVTSEQEKKDTRKYFTNEKIWMIKNLPTIYDSEVKPIRKVPGILRIMMIGRIHPIKNIDVAINMMNGLNGDVTLDIYGNPEVQDYAAKCRELSMQTGQNITVNFYGNITHDRIQDVISEHHVLLSPTQSENFGQAIVESLLNNRPVIISDRTPWRGLENAHAGYDLSLDSLSSFQTALQEMIEMNDTVFHQHCLNAGKYIHERLKVEEIVDEYKGMLLGE